MHETNNIEGDFLVKITQIIEENISNESFGVSELADEIGMSRSNLLRKIKKSCNLSVSLFIRKVRLKRAMEILQESSSTVFEVSFQVGFNSTSYFIKCFHDHYGFPPGEAKKQGFVEPESDFTSTDLPKKKHGSLILISVLIIAIIGIGIFFLLKPSSKENKIEKSIAVLPFRNDSSDSSNVYIINGLMESVLSNLQKINDLRVISRTSVEKYRNTAQLIPEIGRELNVRYFIEGSGQKIGDQILLNIQLIEASTDKHLWAGRYARGTKDIFKLQQEIAKNIAEQIEVIITPKVEEQIDQIPTSNLEAYDLFLKGLDLLYQETTEGLEQGIVYFRKALELDPEFARAYADIAIAYYYLDVLKAEKKYKNEIIEYADKALLFDAKSPQSLVAKALSYMANGKYDEAVPFLEKALEYNPNSAFVLNFLSDYYASYAPNTEKYLEYALKGIRLDVAAHDSASVSFIYLHLSNAFIQTGFAEESEKYINKSLDYKPNNIYSEYVKTYILLSKDLDFGKAREQLIQTLQKDTTRLDVLQEVAKICYYLRDYPSAYEYYRKFLDVKEKYKLDIFAGENAKIAIVFKEMGYLQESQKMLKAYKILMDVDESIYKDLGLSVYHAQQADTEKAINHLRLFAQQDNYHYWMVLFLELDPLIDPIKHLPEFKEIMKEIESKFWKNHDRIRKSLEEKGVI